MSRPVLRHCLLGAFGILVGVSARPAVGADVNPLRQAPPPPVHKRVQDLSDKLNLPITVELEPGPLKEALGYLQERYNVPFIVDEEAFKEQEIADVRGQLVRLDKMVDVKLRTALELLLKQVEGGILEKDGIIWVLPRKRLTAEVLLRGPVSATFRNAPLGQALEELSDQTGVSVVIDAHVRDMVAQALVTAKLNQVPLDTAVRVLADTADLKPVLMDNLIYVTSPSHAPHVLTDKMPKADK